MARSTRGQCAQVGHPELRLWIYCCPETGEVFADISEGTCDDPGEPQQLDFGPFDTPEDAALMLGHALTRWCARVHAAIGR